MGTTINTIVRNSAQVITLLALDIYGWKYQFNAFTIGNPFGGQIYVELV